MGERIEEITGILNGTTNYILTKMTEDGADYAEVLKDAQAKGFAEADPTADVEGIDVANKLSILIALLFDQYIPPQDIPTTGISQITGAEIAAAAAVDAHGLDNAALVELDGHLAGTDALGRIGIGHGKCSFSVRK